MLKRLLALAVLTTGLLSSARYAVAQCTGATKFIPCVQVAMPLSSDAIPPAAAVLNILPAVQFTFTGQELISGVAFEAGAANTHLQRLFFSMPTSTSLQGLAFMPLVAGVPSWKTLGSPGNGGFHFTFFKTGSMPSIGDPVPGATNGATYVGFLQVDPRYANNPANAAALQSLANTTFIGHGAAAVPETGTVMIFGALLMGGILLRRRAHRSTN